MKAIFVVGVSIAAGLWSCSDQSQKNRGNDACATDMVFVELSDGKVIAMDATPVTVSDYQVFQRASHYVTQAEQFGNSGVFDFDTQTWQMADGASYLMPFGKTGPVSDLDAPATQISFHDAEAFCTHLGKRLPNVSEWEAAAKSGQPSSGGQYPWGDGIKDAAGGYRANVWQGIFPVDQRVEDGYVTASPVKAFPPTSNGFYDLAGNVWEWTTDTLAGAALPGEGVHRITKGGSFLCEPSWCHGYLISGQSNTSPETGLFHTGFRCVCDVK